MKFCLLGRIKNSLKRVKNFAKHLAKLQEMAKDF